MSVAPVSIAVGKCYLRFTEVRRVTQITSNDEVLYTSRMKTESHFGLATSNNNRVTRGRFAQEVEREVPCDYDPYKPER
jgi:hypothetical protein